LKILLSSIKTFLDGFILTNNILVTGAAGFIGSALIKKLLINGHNVIGIDNLNSYYDPKLKKDRIKQIELIYTLKNNSWHFIEGSLENQFLLKQIFKKYVPKIVVNLAAQAGVRYSISNPSEYIQSNLVGFANLIEECSKASVENFIFASSSSVYGGNKKLPFKESHPVNHPVSLYAATKRSNELIAHSYSHLYKMSCIGLRFFTVYGPWGRPDMAPMIFAEALINRKKIKIFNFGNMERDFTYIDDVSEAIYRCCFKKAESSKLFDPLNPNPAISNAPFKIFNVGNKNPINILDFIGILEKKLGIEGSKDLLPIQPGDVMQTAADSELLKQWISYTPQTSIEEGIERFAKWYKDYYDI